MTTKQHGNTGKRNAAKAEVLDAGFSGRCFKHEKEEWVKAINLSNSEDDSSFQSVVRRLMNDYAKNILNSVDEECTKK